MNAQEENKDRWNKRDIRIQEPDRCSALENETSRRKRSVADGRR